MFIADWDSALFMHYQIAPAILQPFIPYDLDMRDGQAYVSLVAFTQRRLRPRMSGRIGQWASSPLGSHEFLNLRTYVRVGQRRGIYFIAEWIPNALAAWIGPRLYGLPYRLAKVNYNEDGNVLRGRVAAGMNELCYRAQIDQAATARAKEGMLDHFLVERYTAFTWADGKGRRFEVAHEPWPLLPVQAKIERATLLEPFAWFRDAEFVGANYSAGVKDVRISAPARVIGPRELIEAQN